MSHEFTHNPVKLRIVDCHTGKTKQTLIFVGNVDKFISTELDKLAANTSYNSKVLKKHYGADYKALLGISGISGGEDLDFDDFDIDVGVDDVSTLPTAAVCSTVTEHPETFEESSPTTNEVFITDIVDYGVKLAYSNKVKFIKHIDVSPTDSIADFKLKIFLAADIPIYRQHLYIKQKTRVTPMSYSIVVNGAIEYVNIEKLILHYTGSSTLDTICNIPVEVESYNNKDFTTVVAKDTFTLLHNLYESSAVVDYFLVDAADLITNDVQPLKTDKYQSEVVYYGFIQLYFPLMTYAVFSDFIKNENAIREIYPELLPDKRTLSNAVQLECDISTIAFESVHDSALQSKIFSSITQTTLSIDDYNQDVEYVMNLRNLFDTLELTPLITYCKAHLLYKNQVVYLRKAYSEEPEPRDIIPLNSLLIKIKTSTDTTENMRLVIFKNGNYVVKTEWREENHMDFKKIINSVSEKVNPIIALINKFGDNVKYHKIPLSTISKSNVAFTETSMSFYFDDDVTDAKFTVFKQILNDFAKARIITPKENIALGLEYFFNKGMYKYDASRIEKAIAVSNYYEWMSNGTVNHKWNSIFQRTRLFQVFNVSSKLKLTISGVRDDVELNIFITYLSGLFAIYLDNTKNMRILASDAKTKRSLKTLKTLKVQDPLLYDFKKIYNSPVIYSKICQKPYQPTILSDAEYSDLPAGKKANALRYWNFTKQKPVWYSCPNAKYPFVKFIVKQHPKDFCIPCCKKIAMNENVNIKKQEIHNACMRSHEYTGEKVNLTKGSHYIATYGKDIEAGRISRLPEHTLEPLFFDTYSAEGSIDSECVTADGYYIYGVEQHSTTLDNIGALHCCAHALTMSPVEFINECISRIKADKSKMRVLLGGDLTNWISTDDLATHLLRIVTPGETPKILPWNELICDVVYYYFGINIIQFDDQNKESIELVLPKGLKNYTEMFPESHKNLVVIRKRNKWYPIYLFNTEMFKRTGLIDSKLFLNDSGLITIIRAVVRRNFETTSDRIQTDITLSVIKAFCEKKSLNIIHYYINYSNLCYSCVVEINKKLILIPCTPSHYPLEDDISLIFTPYAGEYSSKFADYEEFAQVFYKWNVSVSNSSGLDGALLYPKIAVQNWISYNNEVIAFICCEYIWYIKGMSELAAKKAADVPIQKYLYHPYKINALIASHKAAPKSIPQPYVDKLNQTLYEYYLHTLILQGIIDVFNKQRNKSMRSQITNKILKCNFDKDLTPIKEIIDSMKDAEDSSKLKNIFARALNTHRDKKQLLSDIQQSYFAFDRMTLEELRGKSIKEIYTELTHIVNSFVVISKEKVKTFPNMFSTGGYLINGKLPVEKSQLHDILQICASEIANPAKWKWIFNSVFLDKTVNYFKFIKRTNEKIFIEFVD